MNEGDRSRVIAVVRDLFFGLRIANTLGPHGYQVETVSTLSQLRAALDRGLPNLLVVDLACAACEPLATIAELKMGSATRAMPILAFGPHVDRAARDDARAAGADRVVANSKLHDDLVPLVARYATPGAASRREADANSGKPETA